MNLLISHGLAQLMNLPVLWADSVNELTNISWAGPVNEFTNIPWAGPLNEFTKIS